MPPTGSTSCSRQCLPASMTSSSLSFLRCIVEVAYPPGWVACPQIRVERCVAGCGMYAAFTERTVQVEQPTGSQDTCGTRDQSFDGGPGHDVNHVDRDDGVCLDHRPDLDGGV